MIIINGKRVYNYRRISKGWKDTLKADYHYKEGNEILSFDYMNHHIIIALCGDIWEYPNRFKCNGLLLWPVYVDHILEEWKSSEKEYAKQANLVCKETLMINSLCDNPISHGNAFHFLNGKTVKSLSYDNEGVLVIDINN